MSVKHERRVFISLGANLGVRETALAAARAALADLPHTRLIAASRIYETAPQERPDQPDFLNQVVCLETAMEPVDLLRETQRVEAEQGRRRHVRFGPRTLDIDILLVEDVESDDPRLTLPHPRMLGRAFVLVPLAEVWGCARGMPAFDIAALAKAAAGRQSVRPFDPPEARPSTCTTDGVTGPSPPWGPTQ